MEKEKIFPQGDKAIGLCSDHAGFELKEYIRNLFEKQGIQYNDFGTYSVARADYPDFAHEMGNAIDKGEIDEGIAICGTGNGINMTLNKHQSVRAALCWNAHIATLARAHNNANVLTLPGREITETEAYDILIAFFNTEFDGGRHQGRIDKIPCGS